MKLSHIPASVYPPVVHFNSHLARVRMWIWHALSQWPSQAFSKLEKKLVCGCHTARKSVSGVDTFVVVSARNFTLFHLSWPAVLCWQQDKMAESRDWSSSTEPQLKFPGCSHYRRLSDNHFRCQQCRFNEGLTLCTQGAPCDVCKDWLRKAWQALERAVQLKRKRKVAVAAKAVKKSQEMDDSIEIHAPEEGLQVPPVKCKDDGSSKKLDSMKRAESAASSTSKAMEADSAGQPSRSRDKKTLSSSVFVVGRSRSDGGPVPSGTKESESHRSRSGDRGRRGHGSERHHDSPRSRHSPRCRSGERTQPTSLSGGCSSRSRQADSTDAPGSGRASGRATEVRPSSSSTHHQHHHRFLSSSSRSSADRKSQSESHHHHGIWESVDKEKSGSSYVSRREVQLSPVAPQETEKRTITVIPSPPRPAGVVWRARQTRQLWPPQQVWQARRTQQRCRTPQVTSQQGIRTRQRLMSPRLWTTRQVLPTRHRSMTWQVSTQHSHRTQQWTTQQGVTGLLPRVPQQGLLQLQDRTLP